MIVRTTLTIVAAVLAGCSASVTEAVPSQEKDAGAVDAVDRPEADKPESTPGAVEDAAIDGSLDRAAPVDADTFDVSTEARTDADADAPSRDASVADARRDAVAAEASKPWPLPGTAFLTKIETQAHFNQVVRNNNVAFLIRRRANDQTYPYPWDSYECIFENVNALTGQGGFPNHLEFLAEIDPERASNLYFVEAKTQGGTLIPGRLGIDKDGGARDMNVLIENVAGLMGLAVFPLDPNVPRLLRERLARCVPYATSLKISMFCPNGTQCPLP